MKILITDDAAFMRTMLKNILTTAGYEIVGEAVDGVDMLAKYEKLTPDLVTLDITMPNMDGVEALKQLKRRHPEATVVMCSAMGQQAMVLESIKAGAKDFIVKPFQAERILDCLKKIRG